MPRKYPRRQIIPKAELPEGYSEGWTDGRTKSKSYYLKLDSSAPQKVFSKRLSESLRRAAGYFPFEEKPYFPVEREYFTSLLLERFEFKNLKKPDGTPLGQSDIDRGYIDLPNGFQSLDTYLSSQLEDIDSQEVLAARILSMIKNIENDVEAIDQYPYHLEKALTWTFRLGKLIAVFADYETERAKQVTKSKMPRKPRLNKLIQKYAIDSRLESGKSAADYWDELKNDLENLRADPEMSGKYSMKAGGRRVPNDNCKYEYYEENDKASEVTFSAFKSAFSKAKKSL